MFSTDIQQRGGGGGGIQPDVFRGMGLNIARGAYKRGGGGGGGEGYNRKFPFYE